MTADYFELARELSDSSQALARNLRSEIGVSTHPDLELGAGHLGTIVGRLEGIDEDQTPESPGAEGVLAESAAEAHQIMSVVANHSQETDGGVATAALQVVVDRVIEAGYNAPDPTYLEWFGDDVPDDGSAL